MSNDTALIIAARAGDRDKCVRLLKDKRTGDVSKRGVDKKTAVMAAAEGGHLDIVELLIEHGASVLDKDKDNNTIIYHCDIEYALNNALRKNKINPIQFD